MQIRIQGVEMNPKFEKKYFCFICIVGSSVVDPESVLGPPGSGPVIILYGCESCHQQNKKSKKTSISTICDFFLTFFYENFGKCTFKK